MNKKGIFSLTNSGLTMSLMVVFCLIFTLSGCGGGNSAPSEDCEGEACEEIIDPPPAPLTCIGDIDCDLIVDACDSDSETMFEEGVDELPFIEFCDTDLDGFFDTNCTDETAGTLFCDNCIGIANPDQADTNGDGNGCDEFVETGCEAKGGDADYDGICDDEDNCAGVCIGNEDWECIDFNPYDVDSDENGSLEKQSDIDKDGIGNSCDGADDRDKDGDGVSIADGDCDDSDPDIHPYAEGIEPREQVGEIDYNCDGITGDVESVVFVDGGNFSDCNNLAGKEKEDGTIRGECGNFDNPYYLLEEAIDFAIENNKEVLYVYDGNYTLNAGDTLRFVDDDLKIFGGLYCLDEEEKDVISTECPSSSHLKIDDSDDRRTKFTGSGCIEIKADILLNGFEYSNLSCATGWGVDTALILINGASPTIKNSIFNGDTLPDKNGIFINSDGKEAAPTITQCEFYDFTTAIFGIAWDTSMLAPKIKDNLIEANTDNDTGTNGILIRRFGTYSSNNMAEMPLIEGNVLSLDNSQNPGTAIYIERTPSLIQRNIVNVSGEGTKGIWIKNYALSYDEALETRIYNNLIEAENSIYLDDASAWIYNNTFVIESNASGLIIDVMEGASNTTIINNIFFTQSFDESVGIEILGSTGELTTSINYNLFSSNLATFVHSGVGPTDPGIDWNLEIFADTVSTAEANNNFSNSDLLLDESNNYTPYENSPAVDRGNNTITDIIGSTDVDGDERLSGDKVDIGAQEYSEPKNN